MEMVGWYSGEEVDGVERLGSVSMVEIVGGSRDRLAIEEMRDGMGAGGGKKGVVQAVVHIEVWGWLLG